jgi:mono/diheme cytochrome c family protein
LSRKLIIGFSALLLGAAPARGEGPAVAAAREVPALGAELLELLRSRCGDCHGSERPKGRLELVSLEGMARGGKSGPAVERGKLEQSLLWQRVSAGEMPPEKPLKDAELAVIRRWIEGSAPGLPEAGGTPAAAHWAFLPVRRPEPPAVRDPSRVLNEVDLFIQAALEARGLGLGPESDRATLARRLSFGLTGLPPAPGEIDELIDDPAPEAYERLLERLLASPHHGERWGKHWLDAAGYADSNGYFHADTDRPLAWRYRDWVVRAVNDDKPFDRFISEQLAGDEIAGYRPGGDVTPEMAELLTATHFLRNAQDGTGESDGNELERLIDKLSVLEGTVEIIGSSLLGLTLQCARCHDHKFEPLTQVEYYRLQAIFSPAFDPKRWLKPNERFVTLGSTAERKDHERRSAIVDQQIDALKKGLEGFAAPLRRQLIDERLSALAADERALVHAALDAGEKERTEAQKALLEKHAALLKVSDEELAGRFPELAGLRRSVEAALMERRKERPEPLPSISCLFETAGEAPPHHILERGAYTAPGEEVAPGVPEALSSPANRYSVPPPPEGATSTGRRSALARWLTSPENPVLARITANRIWQHHFGAGLVATPANLGSSGGEPSHPELLDFLASELVRSGWSLKALHRLIAGSTAYRQSSALRPEAFAVDPENRLLWRFSLQRLDAEGVRDAMLSASGELDRRIGGPYVPAIRGADGQVVIDPRHEGARRRSLYVQQRRTQVLSLLEVFDAPVMVTSCTRRPSSTVPLQSLALLNSEFALASGRAFAERLSCDADDGEARLGLAFRLAFGRGPTAEERTAAEDFLRMQPQEYAEPEKAGGQAWADFCQMLLASSAFLHVE